MIAASELRLNNSVKSNYHNGLVTEIKSLSPTEVRLWANPIAIYKYENIEPIPISDKILNKCEFGDEHLFYDVYLYRITVTGSRVWIGECKYLHQLQNLYYALTQTELTINNTK